MKRLCHLGQHRIDSGKFAKIEESGIQVVAISEACVFIRLALEHFVDVAVGGNEPVWPEGNAALEEALLDLPLGRFEYGGANDGHPEFAIHPADTRQNTLTHFADESDRESATFPPTSAA